MRRIAQHRSTRTKLAPSHARMPWLQRLTTLLLLAAASCQRPAPPAPEPAAPKPLPAARTCPTAADARYPAPENVYAAYAEAINQSRWCDAVASFEDASKPRVTVANFKSFALLAGTPNPKQHEYAAALKQLCQRHRLDCKEDGWLARFVPATKSPDKGQPQLAAITKLAQEAPAATYLEVMDAMQSVQADALAHLDPKLFSIENRGDTATGMGRRAGGVPIPLTFVRTAQGWKLSMPK